MKSIDYLGGIMISLKRKCPQFLLLTVIFFSFPLLNEVNAATSENNSTKDLIKNQCVSCHKFEGKPESRFNLKAPDLMWGGNKYKRDWLVRFLTGKERNLYQQNYRWDKSRKPTKHAVVTNKEAEAIADYFKKNLNDSRIKKNALDLSHKEDGKAIGGSQSTSFHDAGQRLNVDWVYRFNFDPPPILCHIAENLLPMSASWAYATSQDI
jgi:mono/diheme cytochrome c family protein